MPGDTRNAERAAHAGAAHPPRAPEQPGEGAAPVAAPLGDSAANDQTRTAPGDDRTQRSTRENGRVWLFQDGRSGSCAGWAAGLEARALDSSALGAGVRGTDAATAGDAEAGSVAASVDGSVDAPGGATIDESVLSSLDASLDASLAGGLTPAIPLTVPLPYRAAELPGLLAQLVTLREAAERVAAAVAGERRRLAATGPVRRVLPGGDATAVSADGAAPGSIVWEDRGVAPGRQSGASGEAAVGASCRATPAPHGLATAAADDFASDAPQPRAASGDQGEVRDDGREAGLQIGRCSSSGGCRRGRGGARAGSRSGAPHASVLDADTDGFGGGAPGGGVTGGSDTGTGAGVRPSAARGRRTAAGDAGPSAVPDGRADRRRSRAADAVGGDRPTPPSTRAAGTGGFPVGQPAGPGSRVGPEPSDSTRGPEGTPTRTRGGAS